jgi:hypothetical protein
VGPRWIDLDPENAMRTGFFPRRCLVLAISLAMSAFAACAKSDDSPPPNPDSDGPPEGGTAEAGVTEAGSDGSSGDSSSASRFCEAQACGTTCPCTVLGGICLCDGDEQKSACQCNAAARCVARETVTCSVAEYEPCKDKACGAACSPCQPGSPGCAPTEPHHCDADGFCKRGSPACD